MHLERWWQGPPAIEVAFGHDTGAPRLARHALQSIFTPEEEHLAAAVLLVASELVSNVVQHTSDGGVLRAWHPTPSAPARVEVADTNLGQPISPAQTNEFGGRGLHIVDAFSNDWGVSLTPPGKIVWAVVNRH